MATADNRMEYLILFLSGLSLTCAILIGDHSVYYEGQTEVTEGDAFQISCKLPTMDPTLWTINSSVSILEENHLGYLLTEGDDGSYRRELILRVNYAQLYQEGEYRCNKNSRDFHYVRVIPALADAHEQAEMDDDDDEAPTSRPPYEFKMEVSETYEFSCTTAKDDDTPITWYKNSARIMENRDSNVKIMGRDLLIKDAQEEDAGEYMCIVEPQYDSGYLGEGRIFRLISPTKIVELPDLKSIEQGDIIDLQCRTQGYPEPKITWLIGNLPASDLKKTDSRISLHSVARSTSKLIVRNLTFSDRGLYTCRAENTIDPNSPQIDEESVFVHVRAVSGIDFTSTTTYVKKGGKFTLTCQVPGLGVHLWYKDGKPITPNAINKFHLEQDSPAYSADAGEYFTRMFLTVQEADSIHTGEYKCSIDSQFPKNVIVVTENMIVTNEDYPGMGKVLIPGEPLALACNTTECPHCTVVWFKDGELLNETGGLEIHGNNTITIDKATYEDSGIYTCKINRAVFDIDLSASIVVQSKISLKRFDQSSVAVQGSPLELYCQAVGGPMPQIKWYIGDEEVEDDDERVQILDHKGLKDGKLYIEEAEFSDRNHYTCEAFNQIDSVNTTTFIRIKDKLAALWPFLGICAEVAILCTIIFVYERRKSMSQIDEPDTDLPAENKHQRDQKAKGQDVRQRK